MLYCQNSGGMFCLIKLQGLMHEHPIKTDVLVNINQLSENTLTFQRNKIRFVTKYDFLWLYIN